MAGLSVGSFLQVLSMDQQSCILEVENKRTREKGLFYLKIGKLLDAEFGSLSGENAAMEMISWDEVNLNFRPATKVNRQKNIEKGLMLLLMEASRIKDERGDDAKTDQKAQLPKKDEKIEEIDQATTKKIKEGIEFLTRDMGEALVSASVIRLGKGRESETFGDKNKKMVDFCFQAKDLMNIISMSKFKIGKYFILALEGKIIILLIPLGKYLWEISLDSDKMKLGLFLNIILPKLTSTYSIGA